MKRLAIFAGLFLLLSISFSGLAAEEVIQRGQGPVDPVQVERPGELEAGVRDPVPHPQPEAIPGRREGPAMEYECPPGQHFDGERCVCPERMRWNGEFCEPMVGAESGREDGGEATPINLPAMPDDGGEATPINLP
jgi:hypothetical protein